MRKRVLCWILYSLSPISFCTTHRHTPKRTHARTHTHTHTHTHAYTQCTNIFKKKKRELQYVTSTRETRWGKEVSSAVQFNMPLSESNKVNVIAKQLVKRTSWGHLHYAHSTEGRNDPVAHRCAKKNKNKKTYKKIILSHAFHPFESILGRSVITVSQGFQRSSPMLHPPPPLWVCAFVLFLFACRCLPDSVS